MVFQIESGIPLFFIFKITNTINRNIFFTFFLVYTSLKCNKIISQNGGTKNVWKKK